MIESTYIPISIAFEAKTAHIFFESATFIVNVTVITIPASVEVICECCFSPCWFHFRVTFATGSCLKRIEKEAFHTCWRLKEIEIPASVDSTVEVLFERCFSRCSFLPRVTLAVGTPLGSCLKRIGKSAFSGPEIMGMEA